MLVDTFLYDCKYGAKDGSFAMGSLSVAMKSAFEDM
jgi:hypothetical protein